METSALSGLSTALIGSFDSIVTDLLALMTGLLPIGISVFAVALGIHYGKKFFKEIAKP